MANKALSIIWLIAFAATVGLLLSSPASDAGKIQKANYLQLICAGTGAAAVVRVGLGGVKWRIQNCGR